MKRREEFLVGDRTTVSVHLKSGAIEIRSGVPGRALVSLDSDNADDWDIVQLGDSLSVEPGANRGWKTKTARVLVEVPDNSDVEVVSGSADVSLAGSFSAARVRTSSGDVRVDDAVRLTVTTASGDMRVRSVSGEATFTAASGNVDLRDVAGRLNVSTASGDVRVSSAGADISVVTVSGDVRIDQASGASIAVKCISGDVTLGLPAGIRVEPDLSTLSGRTTLPPASVTSPRDEPGAVRRIVGVRISTVSGNITISRV